MTSIEERVALVTGANRGIGEAIARGLAKRGWQVIVSGRDLAAARATAATIAGSASCELDVSNPASIESTRDWVRDQFGRLDALVNNAAINPDFHAGLFEDGVVRPGTLDPEPLFSCATTPTPTSSSLRTGPLIRRPITRLRFFPTRARGSAPNH